ncbi:chromate transporter [Azorhizobium doebereinerae]|uniref:chromate transporter n=1 Tax=Azorhizobium doebereinerae TaxID=281091 RepID=UPI0003FBD4B7|nr:chromate transporter [Azorhizobium doebereinerae]
MTRGDPPDPRDATHAPDARELFLGFLRIAVSGFGGTLPFARREMVEQRKWLTAREFTDILAICQLMPGPNICNMSFCIGARFAGLPGVVASFVGLVTVPCIIGISLTWVYLTYGQFPAVSGMLRGISAGAVGLFIALGIKMAWVERRSPFMLIFAALAFVGAGLLGLPLVAVILGLAPFSILASWRWAK